MANQGELFRMEMQQDAEGDFEQVHESQLEISEGPMEKQVYEVKKGE